MEKVSCHLASVFHAVCVCVSRISLGGEGNVLYPVLSSLLLLLSSIVL